MDNRNNYDRNTSGYDYYDYWNARYNSDNQSNPRRNEYNSYRYISNQNTNRNSSFSSPFQYNDTSSSRKRKECEGTIISLYNKKSRKENEEEINNNNLSADNLHEKSPLANQSQKEELNKLRHARINQLVSQLKNLEKSNPYPKEVLNTTEYHQIYSEYANLKLKVVEEKLKEYENASKQYQQNLADQQNLHQTSQASQLALIKELQKDNDTFKYKFLNEQNENVILRKDLGSFKEKNLDQQKKLTLQKEKIKELVKTQTQITESLKKSENQVKELAERNQKNTEKLLEKIKEQEEIITKKQEVIEHKHKELADLTHQIVSISSKNSETQKELEKIKQSYENVLLDQRDWMVEKTKLLKNEEEWRTVRSRYITQLEGAMAENLLLNGRINSLSKEIQQLKDKVVFFQSKNQELQTKSNDKDGEIAELKKLITQKTEDLENLSVQLQVSCDDNEKLKIELGKLISTHRTALSVNRRVVPLYKYIMDYAVTELGTFSEENKQDVLAGSVFINSETKPNEFLHPKKVLQPPKPKMPVTNLNVNISSSNNRNNELNNINDNSDFSIESSLNSSGSNSSIINNNHTNLAGDPEDEVLASSDD